MAQRTVDVHNHWYPPDYLAYLVSRSEAPYARQTGPHSYVCYAPGDVIVAHIDRPGHFDLKARIEDLDAAGLDTQVMSVTIPGPEMLPAKEGVYWAKRINDQLADDLSSNRFVTAFLGVLDTASHRLTYHAGGQGPILHYHAARGEATLEAATTLPMGMMPIFKPTAARLSIVEPGDVVAAITDGIYEYENPAGKMFGDQRVVDLVRQESGSSADRILQRIVDEVARFADGAPQNDDMTLVIVKRLPLK